MRLKLATGGLVAIVLLVGALVLSNRGSDDAESAVAAGSTTAADPAASVTTGAGADATLTSAVTTTAAASPSESASTSEAPTATTTTEVPTPIDERLPRTDASATEADPVPIGEVIEATPGLWDIALTNVDFDAAEIVLAFADINPEPAPGFQYVLVTIEGTYLGESIAQPVFEWAILAGGEEYRPSIPGCGVLPDPIYDVVEIAPGASFRALLCMPVSGEDIAAGIELFLGAPGDEPRFFSLG